MINLICTGINWTPTYIVSQIFVILGLVCLAITYFLHNKKWILLLGVINTLFYCFQYILLEAYTGAFVNLICSIRGIVFYIEEKKGVKKNILTLAIFVFTLIACAIFAWQGWPSLLTIIAGVTYSYSTWQDNIHIYRWLSLLVSGVSITYNVIYTSLFAIIAESVFFVVAIVGVVKLYVKTKEPKIKTSDNQNIK